MFTSVLAPYFSRNSRDRASPYLQHGRITDFACDSKGITAKVRGTRVYRTSFLANYDDQWEPFCSCPAFDIDYPCKHLWALLCHCESLEPKSPGSPSLNARFHIGQNILAWFDYNKDGYSSEFSDLDGDREEPEWQYFLDKLAAPSPDDKVRANSRIDNASKLALVLNPKRSTVMNRLVFHIYALQGKSKKYKATTVNRDKILTFSTPFERDLLNYFVDLNGASYRESYSHIYSGMKEAVFPSDLVSDLIAELAEKELLFANAKDLNDNLPMTFLDKSSANFKYTVGLSEEANLDLDLSFSDNSWEMAWKAAKAQLLCNRFAFVDRALLRLPSLDNKAMQWLGFMQSGTIVQKRDAPEFLTKVRTLIASELIDIPDIFAIKEVKLSPIAAVKFTKREFERGGFLTGELYFRYEDVDASVVSSSLFLKDEVNQRIIHRDKAAEEQWIQTISAVPKITLIESGVLYVFAHDFADIIALLVGVGCAVYLDKRPLSVATPQIEFTSGLDWLELKCSFGEEEIDLAALLRSFQNAASLVTLSDGSVHVLDPKIRKSLERLARHLNKDDEKFVLNKQKIPLLDQILHGMPEQSIPDAVAAYRVALSSSQKRQISPRASFKGTLRPYQLEGFNWLEYMTKLSFGVCLADEMGLGKTIQILALLETRRKASEVSLIVMPRSLVGNWRSEIEKFTPGLKILNFSESKRDKVDFSKWDIVLTTYGVLLKDQELLSATQWQHVILDEAQAIKNHNSQTARAARCLSSRYRVALSGTPIENSTSDLLSLFSFLNPGMLGDTTSEVLRQHTRDPEDLKVLAKSLRPLMLGRKKEDVAQDLPAKVVNILYCEMDKSQKKIYADVIRFYKGKIAEKVEATSFNKSKLLMIEAMLRLRQIACHPSLVDTSHASASSAKIEVLMEKLEELEGTPDKVLVFSQFTSFLRIIENRLTKAKITYEYLDGKTKNRSEKVDNFQNNPEIKVFLISLKAGGVGLNLTAARYTFIMDPWWNPAIEEQAMARAHRIGQTQQVIVYKMVVKDSIEEKILELQSQKEDLVKTFMDGGEENLMRKLSPEDLELLMS